MPHRRPGFPILLAVLLLPGLAHAQRFSYGSDRPYPTQSLSFGYTLIDFTYDGETDVPFTFDYRDPAYGVVFTRPNFIVSLAFGRGAPPDPEIDPRDVQLIDAALFTWGEILTLVASPTGQQRLFVPIGLHTSYRRVSQEEEGLEDAFTDVFSVTVLGIGTGIGFDGELGRRLHVETRVMPAIGLASRSFGDATGSARLLDADAMVHVGRLAGRFGLSVGYGFRIQDWNVGVSDFFDDLGSDVFDYRGLQHALRIGFNW